MISVICVFVFLGVLAILAVIGGSMKDVEMEDEQNEE